MKVDAGMENWEGEYSVQNDVIRGDIHTCFNLILKILRDLNAWLRRSLFAAAFWSNWMVWNNYYPTLALKILHLGHDCDL